MAQGARKWCNMNLAPLKKIITGTNDELKITADGSIYTITLDSGDYSTSHEHFTTELVDQINSKLITENCPVRVKLGGIHDDSPRTVLVFEHTESNRLSTIDTISGSVSDTIIGSIYSTESAES